jgi:hypothetical protein
VCRAKKSLRAAGKFLAPITLASCAPTAPP